MSKRNIHIERLQIRMPRGAAGQAREIAGSLGNEILRKLSETTGGRSGDLRVDEISAGKIANTGAAGVRKAAAERIADEIAKRFD